MDTSNHTTGRMQIEREPLTASSDPGDTTMLIKLIQSSYEGFGALSTPFAENLICDMLKDITPLGQHRITYLDDSKMLLTRFTAELVLASRSEVNAILYSEPDQSKTSRERIEAICDQILASAPTLVITDFDLSLNVKGDAVAVELLRRAPTIQVIGFTAEPDNVAAFQRAGVYRVIIKDAFCENFTGQIAEQLNIPLFHKAA